MNISPKGKTVLLTCITSLAFVCAIYGQYRVASPDKQTVGEFRVVSGSLQYRVTFAGNEVLTWSHVGLMVNNKALGTNTSIISKTQTQQNLKFAWPFGENDSIINHYNQLSLVCTSGKARFNIVARAYDGSIAFRYETVMAGNDSNTITGELTNFRFNEAFTIYQYNHESVFTPGSIDTVSKSCDFPATLTGRNLYVIIGEADNENYTKGELKRGEQPHSLQVRFNRDSAFNMATGFTTPWRTISMSHTAIGLHKFSDLNFRLSPPPVSGVPKGIKPGKLIRSTRLTTQGGLECIDFAAAHNFQYIMFDAGWYGAEFRGSSDPRQVIPELDLPQVISYGKQKGIGVILYVNYVGLKVYIDELLPSYKKWGVAGFKFGFVDGLSHDGLTWLTNAVKKVNDYGFILDIHDNYKPTGLSRTYPALLTQEGIRGDENSPDAFHTTTLPFTRFIAGPADFTFCYPNEKNDYSKNIKVSMAQQLALTVIYYSPLQSMLWYGLPKDYTNEEEIEFFKYVPTVWNETHYLAGDIGKNISVARRHGTTWFVGNAAGFNDWSENLKLDFLTKGRKYTATIYEDGNGTIRKRTMAVIKGAVFPLTIKAKGGQAIIIRQD